MCCFSPTDTALCSIEICYFFPFNLHMIALCCPGYINKLSLYLRQMWEYLLACFNLEQDKIVVIVEYYLHNSNFSRRSHALGVLLITLSHKILKRKMKVKPEQMKQLGHQSTPPPKSSKKYANGIMGTLCKTGECEKSVNGHRNSVKGHSKSKRKIHHRKSKCSP